MANEEAEKKPRGFAAMERAKQLEICRNAGKIAHQKGTAHEWTVEEARAAGRKGGAASRGGRGRDKEPVVAESPIEAAMPLQEEMRGSGEPDGTL